MSKRSAFIKDISVHFPDGVLNNAYLASVYKDWSEEKILEKTGIAKRRIASKDETASDLAYRAAIKIFDQGKIKASDVDFIILCTQAPDYILPTTACILQEKLGISRAAGAVDINLGCSGFVYGLSIAKGLIETGAANCVLLLTADTYSKYIHPLDKSVRTLFGDAAAATAIVGDDSGEQSIGPFVFGTDGRGAKNLIVEAGLFRSPKNYSSSAESQDEYGNTRSAENLFMNGAEVMAFSLKEVPSAVETLLTKAGITRDSVDFFVLHQANKFMLEALRKKLKVDKDKVPILMQECGNTVSSTIPVALYQMRSAGTLTGGEQLMLVGFGVGYSWAACLLKF